ncbi:MAG TPA: ATP-binding protein, partial [Nitrospira sp.]|nr:ATP-binding protein [Nitrospira sp.]
TGAAVQIVYPLPRLRVNRMWATQGLYNLLANAMKFTRDGHPPDIEIASYEAPASTIPVAGVVVKDRGPGVPTRHAERIFMLFQRAVGRNVEGTGAGLTIVRQVAERHGGRAWVQPRAGGGSEFVITFAHPTHNGNGGASAT